MSGDTIDCKHSKIDLELLSGEVFSEVIWRNASGQIFSGLKVKVEKPGIYYVAATASNGCTRMDSITIFDDASVPQIDLQDTFLLPCDFTPVRLFVGSNDSLETFRWVAVGGGFSSTLKNPEVNVPMKVRLFAAASNGCNAVDKYHYNY